MSQTQRHPITNNPIDHAIETIRGKTANAAGIIIGNLEEIYPKDEKLKQARSVVLAVLGDRGLRGQFTVAINLCFNEILSRMVSREK